MHALRLAEIIGTNKPWLLLEANLSWKEKVIKSWMSASKPVRLGRDSSIDFCCNSSEDEANGVA